MFFTLVLIMAILAYPASAGGHCIKILGLYPNIYPMLQVACRLPNSVVKAKQLPRNATEALSLDILLPYSLVEQTMLHDRFLPCKLEDWALYRFLLFE
jgi:hypothetical protein